MRVFAKPSKLDMAGELSNLVRKQWLDAEEARKVATVVQPLLSGSRSLD